MNNNSKTVWVTLKNDVPNNLPQVFTLADGGKLVYYPTGKIDNSRGVKKMNYNSYQVLSPYKHLIEITNLSDFCKALFGVTENTNKSKYVSSFCDMLKGIRKEESVMGWTIPNLTEKDTKENLVA